MTACPCAPGCFPAIRSTPRRSLRSRSLRGWKLGRAIFVGDAGMDSEANRQELAKGLSHYILAMPMGKLTEVQEEVPARAGRFRPVNASLAVKEVVVGEGSADGAILSAVTS